MTRHRRNVGLLVRFGVVGASGVLVNLLTLVGCAATARTSTPRSSRSARPGSTCAGTTSTRRSPSWSPTSRNFQLNRTWTFKSNLAAPWWREYWPFLAVGLVGQVIGLALLTLLMHPDSVISLPRDVFDDSSGLRNRLYWSQLIVITVVTPLSFVLNKLWTFAAVRTARLDLLEEHRDDDVRVE